MALKAVAAVVGGSGGIGTVTSVDVSGGSTGLTTSGGPVTTAGTVTLAGTVNVAHGGTGDTTLTAYAPIFGGTTSTGAVQSGTVGTTGQALLSNGPSALPTMQNTVNSLTAGDVSTVIAGTAFAPTVVATGQFPAAFITDAANNAADVTDMGLVMPHQAASVTTYDALIRKQGTSNWYARSNMATAPSATTNVADGIGATVDFGGVTINGVAVGTGAGTVTHTAGALTANQLVIGNGSADEKTLGTLGTTTTVLHGNASGAPTFGAVSLTADVSDILGIANGGTGSSSSIVSSDTGLSPGSTTVAPSQSAVIAYTAAQLAALDSKPAVAYASTAALPANTYSNGSSGVGATLTGTANGPLIIDGVTQLAIGLRYLIGGEATAANNGWYTLTQLGVVAVSPYILTRATESDQAAEIGPGFLTSVEAPSALTAGVANNGKVFVSVAPSPFTVGSSALTFSAIGNSYVADETTLHLAGNTFSIKTTTGTGSTVVLATSPTLVTPVLGAATATTINKVTLTQPASGSTLTVADGKTLTANNSLTLAGTDSTTMTFPPASANVGYLEVPANSQSAAYTTVLADSGKSIDHPSTDANARTFTIDSNANVAYPVGACLTFTNMASQVVTIAINSDTMYLAGTGTTGSRSLAQYGIATARKLTSTTWLISGTGLT